MGSSVMLSNLRISFPASTAIVWYPLHFELKPSVEEILFSPLSSTSPVNRSGYLSVSLSVNPKKN
jgi:hypothetical protein